MNSTSMLKQQALVTKISQRLLKPLSWIQSGPTIDSNFVHGCAYLLLVNYVHKHFLVATWTSTWISSSKLSFQACTRQLVSFLIQGAEKTIRNHILKSNRCIILNCTSEKSKQVLTRAHYLSDMGHLQLQSQTDPLSFSLSYGQALCVQSWLVCAIS